MIKLDKIIEEFNLENVNSFLSGEFVPGSLLKQSKSHFYWLKNKTYYSKFEQGVLLLSKEDYASIAVKNNNITHLICNESPRLTFILILSKYCQQEVDFTNHVEEFKLRNNVKIAQNVFIGKDVEIGEGTIIYPNVVINKGTKIGKNCILREGCSIATDGLGFENHNGKLIRFPQIGGVVIEDDVEIGPSSTIRRAALDNTIIGEGSKLGSFINIGHNCKIGKNSIFTSQCVVSGSSTLGDNLFMGVQSCIKHGIKIGSNVTIGHGSVITKDFDSNLVLVGNPAETIDDFKKWKNIKKELTNKYI